METIIKYISQPSTWRGILSVLMALGILHISPEVQDHAVEAISAIVAMGLSVQGAINIYRDESKKATTNENLTKDDAKSISDSTLGKLRKGNF